MTSRFMVWTAALVLVSCGGAGRDGDTAQEGEPSAPNGEGALLPASVDSGFAAENTCKRTIAVASSVELKSAAPGLRAGDCVILADGTYTFPTLQASGTLASPIVVRAAHLGRAVVATGGLDVSGAFVVIEGIRWTSNGRLTFNDCSHCRLTRAQFAPVETDDGVDWITVTGHSDSCRIDHNDIGPRTRIGNDVMLAGAGSQSVQYTQVDHNYFHDVHRTHGNGWETIRAGLSGYGFSSAFTTIEHNLFARCDGDPETISMKSSDNVVRYNTMRANAGELTLRHGNRSSVYGNIILGDGAANSAGIRVLGGDHKIWNNVIAGIDGTGITLEGGESNDTTGALTDHKQVYRANVVFNTIVAIGTHHAISVGGAHPVDPIDSTVANNIVEGTGPLFTLTATSKNIRYSANIANGGVGLSRTTGEIRVVDPMLVKSGDLFRLAAGSPAIDAADPSYPYVTDDFEGQARAKPDIGADERSTGPVLYGLLGEADVGPSAP